MDFKQKYLKYKSKYLDLKQQINLENYGGNGEFKPIDLFTIEKNIQDTILNEKNLLSKETLNNLRSNLQSYYGNIYNYITGVNKNLNIDISLYIPLQKKIVTIKEKIKTTDYKTSYVSYDNAKQELKKILKIEELKKLFNNKKELQKIILENSIIKEILTEEIKNNLEELYNFTSIFDSNYFKYIKENINNKIALDLNKKREEYTKVNNEFIKVDNEYIKAHNEDYLTAFNKYKIAIDNYNKQVGIFNNAKTISNKTILDKLKTEMDELEKEKDKLKKISDEKKKISDEKKKISDEILNINNNVVDLNNLLINFYNSINKNKYINYIYYDKNCINITDLDKLIDQMIINKKQKIIEYIKYKFTKNPQLNCQIIPIHLDGAINHSNSVTIYKFKNNNVDSYLILRTEPHRHTGSYCRNSVRKEIRETFLKLDENNSYYLDYIINSKTGIQTDEETEQGKIDNSEKSDFDNLPQEYKIKSPLQGNSGFCASWTLYTNILLILNKDKDLKLIGDYLANLNVDKKTKSDIFLEQIKKCYKVDTEKNN